MSIAITNIRGLVNVRSSDKLLSGRQLSELPVLENAFVLIEGEEIADFGSMDEYKRKPEQNDFDASGRYVFPSWCDSHTHLVFPASRELEFVDKIKGKSYSEIAAAGGGILNSARVMNETSEDQLFDQAWKRLEEIIATGTGAVEIKSGYGLSVAGELKMLRVIKKLKERSKMSIRATFLGAHTYPEAFRDDHSAYIRQIIDDMLPVIAGEKLADYIDVFCEEGFFTKEESIHICNAGKAHGLIPKLHANQMNRSGGVQAGIAVGARSVDHLENIGGEEIALLGKHKETIGTLLPAAAFFLRMPFQPARKLIEAGASIALATDYNPGSAPSGNMNFIVSLACIQMRMLPEEAINAATINGAYAMGVQDSVGSVRVSKKANLFITVPMASTAFLPYSFGSNCVARTMIAGEWRTNAES
jgi:imidazolonepropionase